jgi:SSS family solute:Na+ symporter
MKRFGKDIFNLGQSIISFLAPPMASVFLVGVLWRRATTAAAVSTFIGGAALCITTGLSHLKGWLIFSAPWNFWFFDNYKPHYLLVSFSLFCILVLNMIIVSLFTRKAPTEQELSTLKETYAQMGKQSKRVFALWGALFIVMIIIYAVFN